MAGPIRISVLADASQASREFKGVSDDAGRMGSAFKTAGKIAAAGIAVASAAAVAFGIEAVKAASSAEQSLGATATVFGKFAGQVTKTSNRAAEQFGLSADEYRTNANLLGSLFKNQGVAVEDLGGKTKNMIGVASDLAATFGGTTADAVAALGSAFKGEFDPLEKYGISIKQLGVTQEAWRVAGVDSKKAFDELTDTQKRHAQQVATTNLLMGQAAQAQGAFAKESDTLAHQQQVLSARFDNLKARIGTALLPVVTDLFKVLSKSLMPVLNKLATKYLPPISKALGDWVKSGGAADLFADIGDAIKGIDFGSISEGFGNLFAAIQDVDWGEIFDVIKKLGGVLLDVVTDDAAQAMELFGGAAGFAADHAEQLQKWLPLIVTGFVAFKGAQVLNTIAGRDSLAGLVLQLVATKRLTTATRELGTALQTTTGATATAGATAKTAASRMTGLKKGAAIAGGVAGLGLLAVGATGSSDAMGILGGALSGAAIGSMFGPVGTVTGGAIGGLIGGLTSMRDSTDDASDAFVRAKDPALNYASTLDQVTGAATQATASMVFKEAKQSGVLGQAKALGISARDLTQAALGNEAAMERINTALSKTKTITVEWTDANGIANTSVVRTKDQLDQFKQSVEDAGGAISDVAWEQRDLSQSSISKFIQRQSQDWKNATKAVRNQILATQDFTGKLKGIPKNVRTNILANGIPPTVRGIARLNEQYKLTPKQIKTLIEATGADTTVKEVQKVTDKLDEAGKKAPKPKVSVDSVPANRDLTTVTKKIDAFGKKTPKPAVKINDQATTAISGVNGQLDNLDRRSVTSDVYIVTHRSTVGGGDGGGGDGFNPRIAPDLEGVKKDAKKLKKGILDGITEGLFLGPQDVGPLESEMASDIDELFTRITDAYDKRAEKAERAIGRQFNKRAKKIGEHFDVLQKAAKQELKAAEKTKSKKDDKVAQAAIDDLDQREKKRLRQLDQREKDTIKASNQRWRERGKAVKDSIKTITTALTANARAQDIVNAKLEEARGEVTRLQEAADSFAAGIKDSFTSFGNVVGLGMREVRGQTKVTADAILKDLADRVKKAQDFQRLISQLADQGLNQTTIQQLLAAGPEAGLATAQAIAQGGAATVDEINGLTTQLNTAGEALAADMVDQYHQTGIDAAQAIVDGLINDPVSGLLALQAEAARLMTELGATLAPPAKKSGKDTGQAVSDGIVEGMVNHGQLTEAGEKVARILARAVRRELGIQSPSKVFEEMGKLTAEGLVVGLDKVPVKKAGKVLATDLMDGFGEPTLTAASAFDAHIKQDPAKQTLTVHLTADQLDELQRGRRYSHDIEAWYSVGGKYAS